MNKQDEIQSLALQEAEKTKHDRFSMDIGPGVGKSLLVIKHMNAVLHQFSMFLIAIPRVALKKNWEDEIIKHGYKHLIPHVHFTTYRSLHKLKKSFDWIYLDECHNFKSDLHFETIDLLSKKAFAITGTFIDKDDFNYTRFTMKFPTIYEYTTMQSINDNVLNDYRIIIHKIPLSKSIRVNSYTVGFLPEDKAYLAVNSSVVTAERNRRYNSLQQLRIIRMKMVQNAMSKVLYAKELAEHLKKKTIIFTESTIHADKVCRHSYHTKNSKIKNESNFNKFVSGEILQLSAVSQLNEGINVPDLEEQIILHSYANTIKAKQRICRNLRLGADTNRIAYIHILMYTNTVDEGWVKKALSEFDNSKIGIYSEEKTKYLMKKANLL